MSQNALSVAVRALTQVDQLDLTPTAAARATQVSPPAVRTLDALHSGSAAEMDDLEALLTYDARMINAAKDYGLPVINPHE